MTDQLVRQLEQLPTDPGIYKYFDEDNELIYVGKAVNLKNRVKSYFTGHEHSPKTQILVSRIVRLETIVVQSEVDALILETNLIKQYRPRYNIILKDDKSHLYIKITLYEDLPRVSTCRQTDISQDSKASYFGPFPSGGTVKQTLRYLRRVFPYVARHQPAMIGRRRPPQSYFYFNLPLGPVDLVIDKKLYRKQIFELVRFLEGKRLQVAAELEKDMKQAAKRLDFEQAAEIKQQLDGLSYISQQTIRPETYVANPELMAEKRERGLIELARALQPFWPNLDFGSSSLEGNTYKDTADPSEVETLPLHRIECYDISNISGQQAVGSMVVFEDGEAKKSDYRKFRIKRENTPNDFAMLQEVLRRRFARLKQAAGRRDGKVTRGLGGDISGIDPEPDGRQDNQEILEQVVAVATSRSGQDESFASVPDLIIVDGGKGQLSAAMAVMAEMKLEIAIVGMTKREEELVIQRAVTSAQLQDTEHVHTTEKDKGSGLADGDQNHSQNSGLEVRNSHAKPNRSSAHASFARSEAEAYTQTTQEANFSIIRLARGSEALFLIQRLRDEAHRFAITYHRKLRSKDFLPSKK